MRTRHELHSCAQGLQCDAGGGGLLIGLLQCLELLFGDFGQGGQFGLKLVDFCGSGFGLCQGLLQPELGLVGERQFFDDAGDFERFLGVAKSHLGGIVIRYRVEMDSLCLRDFLVSR